MDAHTPVESISLDQISLQDLQPSWKEEQSTAGHIVLNKVVGNASGKLVHWQEAKDLGCTSNEDGSSDTEEILCQDHSIHEAKSALKCFKKDGKWSNYTVNSDASSDGDEDEDYEGTLGILYEGSEHSPYSHATAFPMSLKFVSAMKGSREKQGLLSVEKTVTWAPDVYDPPPTVLSEIVVRGQKQQKSKKEENKQKGDYRQKGGKSSKWGSGKDKKQLNKIAGSSKRCYKSLESRERLVSSPYGEDYDYDDSNW